MLNTIVLRKNIIFNNVITLYILYTFLFFFKFGFSVSKLIIIVPLTFLANLKIKFMKMFLVKQLNSISEDFSLQ